MTTHLSSTATVSSSSSSSPSPPLPVIIIGGGIAGLGAALALQNEHIPVQIYERDGSFEYRKQGYGMTLQAFQPLQELGVYKEVREADTASYEHWTFNPEGYILGYFGRNIIVPPSSSSSVTPSSSHLPSPTATDDDNNAPSLTTLPTNGSTGGKSSSSTNIGVSTERGNVRIPREILRQILVNRLQPGTVHYGYKLLKFYECSNNTIKCYFEKLSNPGTDTTNTGTLPVSSLTSTTRSILEIDGSLLVGADGIHSNVRKGLQHTEYTSTSNLSYLGVFLILGISTYQHYLLKNKGFYTIDGQRRLFTMPFTEGSTAHPTYAIHPVHHEKSTTTVSPLTMWQLSFALDSIEEAKELSKAKPSELLQRALRETNGWHEPVQALLEHTIMDTTLQLWGTPLYDFGEEVPSIPGRLHTYYKDKSLLSTNTKRSRSENSTEVNEDTTATTNPSPDGEPLLPGRNYYVNPLVTLIGDAAHPMSPFKGQGANQALRDGPALAKWIKKAWTFPSTTENSSSDSENDTKVSSQPGNKRKHNDKYRPRGTISSAILNFEREMMVRAGAKVVASREAAHYFHSPEVLNEPQKIAGIKDEDIPVVLEKVKKANVGAWCNEQIIPKFCEVVSQYIQENSKV